MAKLAMPYIISIYIVNSGTLQEIYPESHLKATRNYTSAFGGSLCQCSVVMLYEGIVFRLIIKDPTLLYIINSSVNYAWQFPYNPQCFKATTTICAIPDSFFSVRLSANKLI